MNIALLETAAKERYNAGNKARQDSLRILLNNDFIHVPLFYNGKAKPIIICEAVKAILAAFMKSGKGDIIFIQYPYMPDGINTLLMTFLSFGSRIKGYKVAVLIHDINALRSPLLDTEEGKIQLKQEADRLALGDYVICHNQSMRKALKDVCSKMQAVDLGIFDYLYNNEVQERKYWKKYPQVVVAGNLSKEKSGYVYGLGKIKNVDFCLYGAGYVNNRNEKNITYKGTFPPEQLIEQLEGNFGLVWDGPATETCSGAYGNYLRYNNPHKFSLYMAAGLPVIVWEESALATFVQDNNVGIVLKTLTQLSDLLNAITEENYREMVNNVLAVRKKVINGVFLSNVIKQILK